MRWIHQGREKFVLSPTAGRCLWAGALLANRYSQEQRCKSGQGSRVYNELLADHLFGWKCYMLHCFRFLNVINDGLDTAKTCGFQQQQEVVPPTPDLLKGGKGSWEGTQPLDWVITGLQGACGRLLLPTEAAFSSTNKMPFAELRIFGSVQCEGFVDVVVSFWCACVAFPSEQVQGIAV